MILSIKFRYYEYKQSNVIQENIKQFKKNKSIAAFHFVCVQANLTISLKRNEDAEAARTLDQNKKKPLLPH